MNAKVKMLRLMAGPKFLHRAGEVVDVPLAFAKELVERRFADWMHKPQERAGQALPRAERPLRKEST